MTKRIIDCIDVHSVAEAMSALECFGMSLDLANTVRLSLIEETLTDGSKTETVVIEVRP